MLDVGYAVGPSALRHACDNRSRTDLAIRESDLLIIVHGSNHFAQVSVSVWGRRRNQIRRPKESSRRAETLLLVGGEIREEKVNSSTRC